MIIENEKKLSSKGLLLSILAMIGLEIVNQVIAYFFNFAFLQTYFYFGWIIYAAIFGSIYHHYKTGNETFWQYLFVAVLNIVVINLTVYLSYVVILTRVSGASISEVLVYYSIPTHFSSLYLDSVSLSRNGNSANGIGLPGWIFEIPGYFVMLYLSYRIMKEPSKKEIDKKFEEFENKKQDN